MLEQILPNGVAVVAAQGDLDARPFPEEEWIVRNAVESRRREFTTARACAREALGRLGLPVHQAISAGPYGDPQWPAGVVGGITHCEGYRAAAVARTRDFAALGIDAEPNEPLPDNVLGAVAMPSELQWIRELTWSVPDVAWDRLLFSIKEAVYKAWFPLTARRLGFRDATVVVDLRRKEFLTRLGAPGFVLGDVEGSSFSGRWLIRDGLIGTAIALPA